MTPSAPSKAPLIFCVYNPYLYDSTVYRCHVRSIMAGIFKVCDKFYIILLDCKKVGGNM